MYTVFSFVNLIILIIKIKICNLQMKTKQEKKGNKIPQLNSVFKIQLDCGGFHIDHENFLLSKNKKVTWIKESSSSREKEYKNNLFMSIIKRKQRIYFFVFRWFSFFLCAIFRLFLLLSAKLKSTISKIK